MSEASRRRRRKEAQGCATALVLFGGFLLTAALAIGALTAESPVNGICLTILGIGCLGINRPLAEGGALRLLALDVGGTVPPSGKLPSYPHWYAPARLAVVGVGAVLIVLGLLRTLGV
jgi:hypothetical protein